MMEDNLIRLLEGPVVFNLIVIIGCWLYYSNRSGWTSRPVQRGHVYRCFRCGNVYEGDRHEPRNACPKCGEFNDTVMR